MIYPSDKQLRENGLPDRWEMLFYSPMKWVVLVLGIFMYVISKVIVNHYEEREQKIEMQMQKQKMKKDTLIKLK